MNSVHEQCSCTHPFMNTLLMNSVHEQCSWTLFMNTIHENACLVSAPYRPGGLDECAFLLLEEEESEEEKGERKTPTPLELT